MSVVKQELQVYMCDNKIRGGCDNDGGYVYADMGNIYDCYISAGVSNEESFSKHFIEKHVMNYSNCFAFDGTIANYPYEYTTNISFIRKNIGASETAQTTNLSSLIEKYQNIFLKMDIEGGEYEWIPTTDMNHFSQIVIEFHGINYTSELLANYFRKMNQTHYLIHAHGNNWGGVDNTGLPHVIELTYLHKKYFENVPDKFVGAIPDSLLDQPNRMGYPDLHFCLH